MTFAELQVTTNYSFLQSGSDPGEFALAATALGYQAIGIADRATLAGVVRMHVACRSARIRLVVGTRLDLTDAPPVLVYPTDRAAYGRLSRLLTLGKRRTTKGNCALSLADLADHGEGQVVVSLAPEGRSTSARLDRFRGELARLKERFADRAYLAVSPLYRGYDRARLMRLGDLADGLGVPLMATNDALYHHPGRHVLHDVVTCIRLGCTLADAGKRLLPHGERYLKAPEDIARLFAARPDAVAGAAEIAARCTFSLDELRYEYPAEPVPAGSTPQRELVRRTWAGAAERYPQGVPAKVVSAIEHEFDLVAQLNYAPYFLTVHDIVLFARGRGILCQGRGSAANSAICYCLGITAVDPTKHDLLFERFVSAARDEPPDIDVDFEHERREEVIQYIYARYGRERAGLAATVITYRSKLAIREVGKVLGLTPDTIGALAKATWGRGNGLGGETAEVAGLDGTDPTLALAIDLAQDLRGFPRHLSQHVGGFVITRGRLDEMVPVENAAMEDRTVIEWDKDDLDALGLLKIDILALGMLSCLRKGFELLSHRLGRPFGLADVPAEDPGTYDMICKADTVGVFQIESRAQMTMLPRLRPRVFYDLVVEVAIIRPGPIQGDMVHPYLRRRQGLEAVEFPTEELRAVLVKTLGVPLFQEQAMRIAIVAAGFTPEEADRLRKAMATFKKHGEIEAFRDRFVGGMIRRGYQPDFAERCFQQLEGFGSYGFPESHAASFALLAYASAWMKHRHPAIFACALLNSQPMGFYATATIVRDAREHGVDVRPVDVNRSDWDCTLEEGRNGPAVRLGLREVKGLREADAVRIAMARGDGYATLRDVWRRAGVPVAVLERLAGADAFMSMGLDRRRALWEAKRLGDVPLPLFAAAEAGSLLGDNRPPAEFGEEPLALLPSMPLGEAIREDYRSLSLSLKGHPCTLLRPQLAALGMIPAVSLAATPNNRRVSVAGLVLVRQQPGTASGVIFATLEDETGIANVIIWPALFARQRREVLTAALLGVHGRLQREGEVIHVIADRLVDLGDVLRNLTTLDGDVPLEPPLARADEVKRAEPGSLRLIYGEGRNFR